MKTHLKLHLIFLFFILILISPFYTIFPADNTEPLSMPILPMIRAMGGAFTGVADNENSVFYNPAGYALIDDGIITVFSLGVKANIDDSALDLYNALISGEDITSSSNIEKYLSNTTVSPGVAGPIYFGRVGNNFGFAFYNNLYAILNTTPGGLLPSAELYAYTDLGFVGGYGFSFPFIKNLYAGVNLTVLHIIDTITDTSNIPLAKAIGFGGDIGFLYSPVSWFRVGVCAKDFFGTHFSTWESLNQSATAFGKSYIKPRIALGIALFPLKASGAESRNFRNLVIALDYTDLLDYSSVFSNINLGVGFNALRILDISGGFEGGYLAAGIGFDLKIFHLNLAYFVDELGSYPGANPVQNVMFNFAFRW